jgi:phospholipid/cholesterol/gamma-HCH transport system ATP-binding protein
VDLYDNTALPLREHTRRSEREIREIVMRNLERVGLAGAADRFPGEVSGGMRKRAGLARALVLDREIVLFDEPDSGLGPVRVSFLNELILQLREELAATFVIVTHDIPTARNIADYIGMLFRRNLVMFGQTEELFGSDKAVVTQFLHGRTLGPIGMSEEADAPGWQEAGDGLGATPPTRIS